MKAIKLSEDLQPISELGARGEDLVQQVEDTGRPVVITRHGRGVAVVLSLETYEHFQQVERRVRISQELQAGEADIAAGRLHTHEDVMEHLRRRLAKLAGT